MQLTISYFHNGLRNKIDYPVVNKLKRKKGKKLKENKMTLI